MSDRCPMGYLLLKPSDTLHTHCRHIEHLHEEIWCHKKTFWQNDSVLNLARFLKLFLNVGLCSDSACMGKSTCTRAFTEGICFFAYTIHNVDTLNICTKKFDAIKILLDKMTAFWTKPFFDTLLLNKGFVSAQIMHGEINLYQSFYWRHLILCIRIVDTLNICMKNLIP